MEPQLDARYPGILPVGVCAYKVYELLDLHKLEEVNTMGLSYSFYIKKVLLRWDSNPQHTACKAVTLQLSYI